MVNKIGSVSANLYDHFLPVHNPKMVPIWIRVKVKIKELMAISAGTPSLNHSATDASARDGNNPRPIRKVDILYEKLIATPRPQSATIILTPVGLIFPPVGDP